MREIGSNLSGNKSRAYCLLLKDGNYKLNGHLVVPFCHSELSVIVLSMFGPDSPRCTLLDLYFVSHI